MLTLYLIGDHRGILKVINPILHTIFISSIVLAPILQYLWGFVNSLQLIVHLPVFSFRYPASVYWSMSLFKDFTNFNVLSLEQATANSEFFKFTETEAYSWQFEFMGYRTKNALENFSFFLWYSPGVLGIFVILIILKKLSDFFDRYLNTLLTPYSFKWLY